MVNRLVGVVDQWRVRGSGLSTSGGHKPMYPPGSGRLRAATERWGYTKRVSPTEAHALTKLNSYSHNNIYYRHNIMSARRMQYNIRCVYRRLGVRWWSSLQWCYDRYCQYIILAASNMHVKIFILPGNTNTCCNSALMKRTIDYILWALIRRTCHMSTPYN